MGSATISIPALVKIKAARCKHSKEDLFIFIDTNKTIYADSQEHVPGDLHFFAAAGGMTLNFEANNVFYPPKVTLTLGDNLVTPKGSGSTRYAIDRLPTDKPTAKSGDPILVVP